MGGFAQGGVEFRTGTAAFQIPGQKADAAVGVFQELSQAGDTVLHQLGVTVGGGVNIRDKAVHLVPVIGKDIFVAGTPPDGEVKIHKEKGAEH
jgi:hypothetical protein